jgi:hypothetical protein
VPDEDSSCDPWVYEAIIVPGLTRLGEDILAGYEGPAPGPYLGWSDPGLNILEYRVVDCMSITDHSPALPNLGEDEHSMLVVDEWTVTGHRENKC